jgi:hypothetical protein
VNSITVTLQPDEIGAFEKARAQHRNGFYSAETFARLLIRDELIRMGVLRMPGDNRAKGARRG